jgi:hypothetical protein
MLKTLAILAVLYAFLPIYGQEKTSQPDGRKDNPRNGKNSFSNPYPSSVPITVTAINQQTPQGETQRPSDDPKSYFSTLISPNNLPNLGLVAVGVFGIVLAWKTVNATRDAAKAALKQANHLVASDRAWILETISCPFDRVPYQGLDTGGRLEIPMAKVWVKNHGKSVARIRDFRLRFHTVPDPGKMPPFPDYTRTKKPQELGLNGIMGAPAEEHDMPVALEDITLSRETAEKVERGEIGLWLYGFVEYDTFGQQCITQFC